MTNARRGLPRTTENTNAKGYALVCSMTAGSALGHPNARDQDLNCRSLPTIPVFSCNDRQGSVVLWHNAEDFVTAAIVSAAGGTTDTLRGYMFALPGLWAAIVRRIAIEHLLNPPRINARQQSAAPHLAFALAREYPPDQMRIIQEGFKKQDLLAPRDKRARRRNAYYGGRGHDSSAKVG